MIPYDKKMKKKLCFFAVKKNKNFIKLIPQSYLDEDICSLAIRKNPKSIQYIPNKFISTELCMDLLLYNFKFAKFIPFDKLDLEKRNDLILNIIYFVQLTDLIKILSLLLKTDDFPNVINENWLLKNLLLSGFSEKIIKSKIIVLGFEYQPIKILRLIKELLEDSDNRFLNIHCKFLKIMGIIKNYDKVEFNISTYTEFLKLIQNI